MAWPVYPTNIHFCIVKDREEGRERKQVYLSSTVLKEVGQKRKSAMIWWLAWSPMPDLHSVPVVSGKACSGNERRWAHKHKIMSCFVMALQCLKRNTKNTICYHPKWKRAVLKKKKQEKKKKENGTYQVGFRGVPWCICLPETKSSICINNTKLGGILVSCNKRYWQSKY